MRDLLILSYFVWTYAPSITPDKGSATSQEESYVFSVRNDTDLHLFWNKISLFIAKEDYKQLLE